MLQKSREINMPKLRIVHLISSLKIGGAETVLYLLTKHLNTELFEQHVIYFHDGPIREQIEQLGIPVYQLHGSFFQYDPFFFSRLVKLLKKIKPDVIHSSLWAANFFGTFAAKKLKIPIICALHTVWQHEGTLRNVLNYINLPLVRNPVAVSQTVAESFQRKKLCAGKIVVIPNGIDTSNLLKKSQEESITRKALSISETDFIIGSVGRFVPVKNYDLLLDCASLLINKYSGIKIMLVGLGPQYQKLKSQAESLKISDHVYFVIGQPAYRYYKLFDCFVQPSTYEGLSMALLEALCFKIPCVVTGKNSSHEIIKNNYNGLVIEPLNVDQLYQAIETVYLDNLQKNKELRNRFGDSRLRQGFAGLDVGAHSIHEEYDAVVMTKRYSEIFVRVAGLDGKIKL